MRDHQLDAEVKRVTYNSILITKLFYGVESLSITRKKESIIKVEVAMKISRY